MALDFFKRANPFNGEKLHNEELHDWNSSPSIIRIIKARRMSM
jgi:hypothetical protein